MNNKENTTEKMLHKAGQSVHLSVGEKTQIRAQLLQEIARPSSMSAVWMNIIHMRVVQFSLAPLLVLLLLGGVGVASADTLPGDTLYPIKTGILEPVRSATLFDSGERVVYETTLAERRLSEMLELRVRGDLDEDREDTLLADFEKHKEKAEGKAQENSVYAQIGVQSELEAVLRAHNRIFEKIGDERVQNKIQEHITQAVVARSESEATLAVSSDNLKDLAKQKEGQVSSDVALAKKNVQSAADTQEKLQTQVQLDLADQAVEEANASVRVGAFARAITEYEKAKRFAREADTVFAAQQKYAFTPQTRQVSLDAVALLKEKTQPPVRRKVETEATLATFQANEQATSLRMDTEDEEVVPQVSVYTYFEQQLSSGIQGAPTPAVYMKTFPSLMAKDFNGIVANGGIYQVISGEVLFIKAIDPDDGVDASTIESEGHTQLLLNIAIRLGREISSIGSIDSIIAELRLAQRSDSVKVDAPSSGTSPEQSPLDVNEVL